LIATLLCSSGAAGVFIAAPPTSAAQPDCVPERTVTVYENEFRPASIWARKDQFICFVLAPGVGTHRTVTLEAGDCNTRFTSLCERRFDENGHFVAFRFSAYDDYSYFDRYAWEERGQKISGTMHVSAADPTVPPATSPTSSTSTTTTTAPATSTPSTSSTTTTTAPTAVRPFLVPDPAPTTTTTVAANGPPPPATAAPANKDKPKDKGKGKSASPSTPTTAAPAPPDTMPPDFIFDPAALTPSPDLSPDAPPTDSGDEAALNASAAANLLDAQKSDDKKLLVLMALAALAVMLLVGATWAWFTRSSQYDPA
jgi:predicted ribosomally synthesized peptide with SipW-like signal peptide